ncbi:hypothetical protein GCM10009617_02800 [Leifsonia poae]|uniref:Ribosomal RNA adenine methylase transferase N-terminal domain-containing protein n=1 Tax=Leifsonia poae TaxID=110933 RepID=A0A9W6H6T8_9MICO|nr:23S ribosomal RNA methyltransferase Erm [Leifsonia poae]GLJ74707.1 hypothetical protein GCM10017584_02800 [Leifsonia poae]
MSRHDLGQNFLIDRSTIDRISHLVDATDGPIIEIGPGDGALTRPLSRSGRALTAIELDPRRADALRRSTPRHVQVVTGDFLHYRLPAHPHVLVGNVPFHVTTALLRRMLAAPAWQDAVLLVQWEVARRRAGVGGATLMTASWWPWYDFRLDRRVPARAFRPIPSVDGGLLTIARRPAPLVQDRAGYQRFAAQVFTGAGGGLARILDRTRRFAPGEAKVWMRGEGLPPSALPRDLDAQQWARLWRRAGGR